MSPGIHPTIVPNFNTIALFLTLLDAPKKKTEEMSFPLYPTFRKYSILKFLRNIYVFTNRP